MKKIITSLYFIYFLFPLANAQSDFTVTVNNIKQGDSVRVIAQKSSESLFKNGFMEVPPQQKLFSPLVMVNGQLNWMLLDIHIHHNK